MAKRYGGKHSPNTANIDIEVKSRGNSSSRPFANRPARRVSGRARALFFVSLPLLFAGIGEIRQGDAFGMIVELGGFALLALSAWLLNEGLRAEEAYNARKIAKPPAIPRKLFAALLTGVAIAGVSAFSGAAGLLGGLIFGATASLAQLIAFGSDPMRKKGATGFSEFENERAALAIEKAEALVQEMQAAAGRLRDRQLENRVDDLAQKAREMFRTLEEDPRDLPRARKFLSVYLRGARDATVKFADVFTRNPQTGARDDYEALLGDLEQSFAAQRETLLLEDRTDLDVEIEVLRDRLKQEGLTAE